MSFQQYDHIIIAGFPGIGKSHVFRNSQNHYFTYYDSDSSNFSWLDREKGIRNPEFPKNYIKHIDMLTNVAQNNIIMVSTHADVLNALATEFDTRFMLVHPEYSLKDEYLDRYRTRGSSKEFIKTLDENWDSWISNLYGFTPGLRYVLGSGETLADVLLKNDAHWIQEIQGYVSIKSYASLF